MFATQDMKTDFYFYFNQMMRPGSPYNTVGKSLIQIDVIEIWIMWWQELGKFLLSLISFVNCKLHRCSIAVALLWYACGVLNIKSAIDTSIESAAYGL